MNNDIIEQQNHVRTILWDLLSDHKKELITKVLNERTRELTVVLEDVYQPQNISAALRSCECFGIQDAYIISDKHPDSLKTAITRGASHWMTLHPFQGSTATADCFADLRAKGYTLVGTSPHAKYTLEDLPLTQKTALFFGTERTGLTEAAISNLDTMVRIPMVGFTESFNIAVSVSLSMYALTRKLRESSLDWRLSAEERRVIELDWLRQIVPGAREIERRIM